MIDQMYELVGKYIYLPYLVSFISLTYGLKEPCTYILSKLFKRKVKVKYSVFLFATLLAIPFWVLADPVQLLVTYAFGTAMYDLLIGLVVDKIISIFKPSSGVENGKDS